MSADVVPVPEEGAVRVSTLELFFDLVFVFTITQLTTVLSRDPTARGAAQAALMLGVIWWMYGGYAWLTNAVAPDRAGRRVILLAGMAAFLVLALAIPHAFADGGAVAFGLAYLAVVAVHAALFARSTNQSVVNAVTRLAPLNTLAAVVIVVAVLVRGPAEYVLFGVAFGLEWFVTSRMRAEDDDGSGFVIEPAHFVERHGLVVIVAVGESVVAVGLAAEALPLDLRLVLVTVLGLALSACLWWTYFGGDDERAERALAAADTRRRSTLAVRAFGMWDLPLLAGIVSVAAGVKEAIAHPGASLDLAHALFLGGGVALYLAGDVLFRREMRIGPAGPRSGTALAALAVVPLGLAAPGVALVGALVAVLVACFAFEARRWPHLDRSDFASTP